MDDFCKSLHPDLKDSSICINWLRQVIEKCAKLIQGPSCQQFNVWEAIKSMIFSSTDVSIANFNVQINMEPNELGFKDCAALVINVFREYILLASHQTTKSQMNAVLWRALISLVGATAMGCLFMLAKRIYNKYGSKNNENNIKSIINLDKIEICDAEEFMCAVINRNMKIAQYEVKFLNINSTAEAEHLMLPDSSTSLQCVRAEQFQRNLNPFIRPRGENRINSQIKYTTELLNFSNDSPSTLLYDEVYGDDNIEVL